MRPALRLACLVALALLAAGPIAGCAPHYVKGGIQGVSYHVSLDREPVAGASERDFGLRIVMDRAGGLEGTLEVDGRPYGLVRAGDHVEVTDEAVVLVNGAVRPQVAAGD